MRWCYGFLMSKCRIEVCNQCCILQPENKAGEEARFDPQRDDHSTEALLGNGVWYMTKWLETTEVVSFSVSDRIARVTLNRPEKRNALNGEMLRAMRGALMEADDRTDVNVVILAGAGKDFCAGYDLVTTYSSLEADRSAGEEVAIRYRSRAATLDDDAWHLESTQRLANTIFDMHKPVIAKIQGNCLAGGTDLAFLCDMIIAADDARIGFPATRANGTPPSHMWVYHLGPQWAKRMLMTGDCLLGKDAARLGLVLDAVPPDKLNVEVDELARRVSYVDAELLSAQKRVVNMALELQGTRTLQRFAAEMDATAHASKGPRRAQFKQDMVASGLKHALLNRDEPFGDGLVKVNWFKAQ
jgi:enoyl-CoA hydratase